MITIIRVTTAAETTNATVEPGSRRRARGGAARDGSSAGRDERHDASRSDGADADRSPGSFGRRTTMPADATPPPPSTAPRDANPDVTPFDRLGRFVVRRALVGRRRLGRPAPGRPPARAAGPGRAERRRLHPRRPRIGAREGAPRDGARRAAVGAGHRLQQPDARGRDARVRGRRGRRRSRDIADAPHVARVVSHLLAPRQVSADGHTAYDIVFLDLPPDDSPEALPDPARAAPRRARA